MVFWTMYTIRCTHMCDSCRGKNVSFCYHLLLVGIHTYTLYIHTLMCYCVKNKWIFFFVFFFISYMKMFSRVSKLGALETFENLFGRLKSLCGGCFRFNFENKKKDLFQVAAQYIYGNLIQFCVVNLASVIFVCDFIFGCNECGIKFVLHFNCSMIWIIDKKKVSWV